MILRNHLPNIDSDAFRSFRSSVSWTLLLQLLSKASVLITTVIYARILTTSEFGAFAAIQAAMMLSVSLWDLGLSPMLSRDIAAGAIDLRTLPPTVARFRLALLPIYIFASAAFWLLAGGKSGQNTDVFLVMFLAGIIVGLSSVLDGVLRGSLDFKSASLAQIAGKLTLVILLFVLLLMPMTVSLLMVASVAILAEIAVLTVLVSNLPNGLQTWDWGRWRGNRWSVALTFQRSWPFAANGIFTMVYNRADVLLVAALAGVFQAGLYAPASRIQDALMLIPTMASAGLVQVIARSKAQNKIEGSKGIFRISMILSLGITLPVVTVLAFLLPVWVPLALGENYQLAVEPISILIWSVPMAAIEAPILALLIAEGHARLSSVVYATAFVVSIAGQFLLIPEFGANGAALASLIREPAALLACFWCLFRTGLIHYFPGFRGDDP